MKRGGERGGEVRREEGGEVRRKRGDEERRRRVGMLK